MTVKQSSTQKKILTDIYNALYRHFGPQDWWPGDTPFEVAVGAILTQNTNWTNVEKAISNLKEEKVLSPSKLTALPTDLLASLIKPAGYFNVKARRLGNFLEYLMSNYRGSMLRMKKHDIHLLRNELLQVNGIGPETADSIILYGLNKPVFVIDAYTKRILHRHKLIDGTESYDDMQAIFHKNLEKDESLFNEYHALIVMTGKHYCKPKPSCKKCPLERIF